MWHKDSSRNAVSEEILVLETHHPGDDRYLTQTGLYPSLLILSSRGTRFGPGPEFVGRVGCDQKDLVFLEETAARSLQRAARLAGHEQTGQMMGPKLWTQTEIH